MSSPQTKIAIASVIFVGLTLAVLIVAMLGQAEVTCEVCITFHGRTKCRSAAGADREEAIRTATDNACGFLASGMADSISCSNTPPDAATCDE